MTKNIILLLTLSFSPLIHGEAQRVADQTEAKEILDANPTHVVAMLMHGSDWCVAGETIKANVWDTPEFAALLPDNVVLGTYDWRENTLESQTAKQKETAAAATPLAMTASLPTAQNGTVFSVYHDGSWLADTKGPNPDKEILTQTIKLKSPVSMLRLTAMTQPGHPEIGPGRGNGNIVITEVEITIAGKRQELVASARALQKGYPAMNCCDGIINDSSGWATGGKHDNHELYLYPLQKPLPAGVDIELKIHSSSKWKKHTLGRFRIDAFAQHPEFPSQAILQFSKNAARNKAFKLSSNNYPALNCLNAKGQIIGLEDALPMDITKQALAAKIKTMLERESEWNKHLATAATASSHTDKVHALAQAYPLMREARSPEYKNIEKEILKVDAERTSPWTWRVSPDLKTIGDEQKRLEAAGDKQAVLDYLDSLITDSRLSKLDSSQRQNIILRKFNFYRGWKERSEKRFDVLREIIAVDPSTHLAIGAKGYLDMNGHGAPSIAFGWRPKDLEVGEHTLVVKEGVPLNFYKPGFYRVKLSGGRSKNVVVVKGVALVSGNKRIAEAIHDGSLARGKDENQFYDLELPPGYSPEDLTLELDLVVPQDHEHSGTIHVQLFLPPSGPYGWRGTNDPQNTPQQKPAGR